MKETITMRHSEQRRVWVLNRVLGGELTVVEAARLLGLSERSIRRSASDLSLFPCRCEPCGRALPVTLG